jgi:NAD(P)-dependent dehydrogenase (short-subunit alcohol dehydrogenase family)
VFHSHWQGAAYCASKAAIQSFTDGMRLEMKPFGIDVVLIQPGAIKSNLGKNNAGHTHFDEEGPYKPFAEAIRARVALSQSPGATPTEVFASKVGFLNTKVGFRITTVSTCVRMVGKLGALE